MAGSNPSGARRPKNQSSMREYQDPPTIPNHQTHQIPPTKHYQTPQAGLYYGYAPPMLPGQGTHNPTPPVPNVHQQNVYQQQKFPMLQNSNQPHQTTYGQQLNPMMYGQYQPYGMAQQQYPYQVPLQQFQRVGSVNQSNASSDNGDNDVHSTTQQKVYQQQKFPMLQNSNLRQQPHQTTHGEQVNPMMYGQYQCYGMAQQQYPYQVPLQQFQRVGSVNQSNASSDDGDNNMYPTQQKVYQQHKFPMLQNSNQSHQTTYGQQVNPMMYGQYQSYGMPPQQYPYQVPHQQYQRVGSVKQSNFQSNNSSGYRSHSTSSDDDDELQSSLNDEFGATVDDPAYAHVVPGQRLPDGRICVKSLGQLSTETYYSTPKHKAKCCSSRSRASSSSRTRHSQPSIKFEFVKILHAQLVERDRVHRQEMKEMRHMVLEKLHQYMAKLRVVTEEQQKQSTLAEMRHVAEEDQKQRLAEMRHVVEELHKQRLAEMRLMLEVHDQKRPLLEQENLKDMYDMLVRHLDAKTGVSDQPPSQPDAPKS